MKNWTRPSLIILESDQLVSIVKVAAISDCLRKHVR